MLRHKLLTELLQRRSAQRQLIGPILGLGQQLVQTKIANRTRWLGFELLNLRDELGLFRLTLGQLAQALRFLRLGLLLFRSPLLDVLPQRRKLLGLRDIRDCWLRQRHDEQHRQKQRAQP